MRRRCMAACAIIVIGFAAVLAIDALVDWFDCAAQNETPRSAQTVPSEAGSADSAAEPDGGVADLFDADGAAVGSEGDSEGRADGFDGSALPKGAADWAESPIVPTIDDIARARGFERTVCSEFLEEVMDPAGFDEVLVADGGSVVGLVGRGSAAQTFSRLSCELADKGWIGVDSGLSGAGTFVKSDGSYSWLMLSCTDADGLVGVVIQIR
mgnify:CR=1 FL=1